MSPLDRLQELLDERGVKYERRSFDSHNHGSIEYVTWWGVGGLEFNAIRSISDPDMLYIDNTVISPEDAVNATVGRGTCHIERYDADPHGVFVGSPIVDDDGNETTIAAIYGYRCSECGGKFDPDWSYCPNCGRRVVE